MSSDGDGQMVSEISGGLAPTDLVGLTDVLASTLAGLIAMTQPALVHPHARHHPSNAAATPTRAPAGARQTTSSSSAASAPVPGPAT